jgi:hypothetical protein
VNYLTHSQPSLRYRALSGSKTPKSPGLRRRTIVDSIFSQACSIQKPKLLVATSYQVNCRENRKLLKIAALQGKGEGEKERSFMDTARQ